MFEFLPTKERVSLGFMIRQAVTTSLAGVLAAAIVHARPSILNSIRWVFNQEPEPTLFLTKRPSESLEAAQTAVALDPNAAYGYYAMGRRNPRLDAANNRLRISNRRSS